MAEGSDRSGNKVGGMEIGNDYGWKTVRKEYGRRKRKHLDIETSGPNWIKPMSEPITAVLRDGDEKYKVIVKLMQEGASFSEWNLYHLTKASGK